MTRADAGFLLLVAHYGWREAVDAWRRSRRFDEELRVSTALVFGGKW